MADDFVNYYEVLSESNAAGQDEIKRAFRTLAKRYHPDANPTRKEWAERRMKLIMTAYHVLGDDRLRCEHDTRLKLRDNHQHNNAVHGKNAQAALTILTELLNENGKAALALFDRMQNSPGFSLFEHLEIRDYLDCLFLLAEQMEKEHRYSEALEFYEELYREEHEPPRQRYFFDELCERIKNLYVRKLVRKAKTSQEKLVLYERVLAFGFDKSTDAFIYKKIADEYLVMGEPDQARKFFDLALKLKPGMKGISRTLSRLGVHSK